MGTDSRFGLMDLSMMDSGKMTRLTEMGNSFMLMVMFMTVSGKMIKLMAWDIICTLMEPPITENGRMTNNTAKALRHGQMAQGMKGHILKAKSMERGPCALLMGVSILETFSSTKSQEEVNMFGLMASRMKDNGRRIKCMDTES